MKNDKTSYPFVTKTAEELSKEANKALIEQGTKKLSDEERLEDDADSGYFSDEDT